jgi:ornithine carbamoyltransferase
MKRDFLTIRDFTPDELQATLKLAANMKAHPEQYSTALKGKTLALIFEKPSLRTRVTFDVGIQQLGGFSVPLMPSEISLGKRESVYDVAKNLERMVQGIMIRTFAHQIVVDMAKFASVPIINGLTDYSHPCQALADYLTVQEIKGRLQGLKLCFVGDGNNVAHSLMFAGARFGVNVTVACPKGYEPNPVALSNAREDAHITGSRIDVVHDASEGVRNADVIYTDVWASMGQESEAETRKAIFRPFQVNAALMAKANHDAIFLHCLPAHRGDEVTDEVLDSSASFVFQEAENRLHVQKAVMYQLMK